MSVTVTVRTPSARPDRSYAKEVVDGPSSRAPMLMVDATGATAPTTERVPSETVSRATVPASPATVIVVFARVAKLT